MVYDKQFARIDASLGRILKSQDIKDINNIILRKAIDKGISSIEADINGLKTLLENLR